MFLKHLLTYEDRQKLLKLAGWKLIETAPKHMEKSKMACSVRHVRTKYGARELHEDVLLPRIRASTVMRLFRNFRRGQRGIILEQLSILFHLGLGVPKHKQIAEFIIDFEQAEDQKVAIKYIGKLIKQYIASYAFSMDDHGYMYCAQYTEQLLKMQKFISKGKLTDKNKSMRVPVGRPTVLVYSLKEYRKSNFELVDGYTFSETGYPIPISASVLRKEFSAAPSGFSSFALKVKGQYVLVLGVMYWPDGDENSFAHMQDLGSDEYLILTDQYEQYCSKELLEARKALTVDADLHNHHKGVVAKLEHKEVLSEKERLSYRASKRYFTERRKISRAIEKCESECVDKLVKSGPVSSARFFALDIAIMGASHKLRTMVSAKPDALAKSLNAWGFTTALVESSKLLTTRIQFSEKSNRRSWQIDTEKKS